MSQLNSTLASVITSAPSRPTIEPSVPNRGRLLRLAPPLAALVYPIAIWAGPAMASIFLVTALAVPLLGVLATHRGPTSYPRARAVTFAVVGAPPLYSWLGGLLDFQQSIPISSVGLWMALWGALTWAVYTEHPRTPRHDLDERPARLAFLHGVSATIVVAFAMAHLVNHLFGLAGGARHVAVMQVLRGVYRNPLIEPVLLASVVFQIVTGLRLLGSAAFRRKSWFDTLQTASGAYLALFFLSHLTAVLRARLLRHVDTNWVWLTADNMLSDPWSARLAPYYFLAVIALGVHAGAGVRVVLLGHGYSTRTANRIFVALATGAIVVSVLILTALLRE